MSERTPEQDNISSYTISGESRQNARKKKHKWMRTVSFVLPESYVEGLHELVRRGMYPSRSAAIRSAIRDSLKRELWHKRK